MNHELQARQILTIVPHLTLMVSAGAGRHNLKLAGLAWRPWCTHSVALWTTKGRGVSIAADKMQTASRFGRSPMDRRGTDGRSLAWAALSQCGQRRIQ